MSKNRNLFNSIELTRPRSNRFDLSHDVKFSARMGELTPVLVMDCVPGDRFKIGGHLMTRFAPLIAPIMHKVDATVHYFFVPNRIINPDWETYITGNNLAGPDGGPTPARPTVNLSNATYTRLMDYMGLPKPTSLMASFPVDAHPFAAYLKIWNDYYRDQNVIAEQDPTLVPGDNTSNVELITIHKRAWSHDYFTSALPFAQKGAGVDIPLGNIELDPDWSSIGTPYWAQPSMGVAQEGTINQLTDPQTLIASSADTFTPLAYDPANTLTVQPTTITDLRRAFALQKWLELNARSGTRYTEQILAIFGVKSSDARLQRPEYITGVKSSVIISEVLNTTGTDDAPQGAMAGHGVGIADGNYGTFFCEEHGYIIGIMSVLPTTAYQQGIPRMFSRRDRYDYYWPQFEHIGEQSIEMKELYIDAAQPNGGFGYVPRYSEYKYMPSRVAGQFRTTLDFWHMGRIFDTEPALNSDFIQANPTKRVFAVLDPEEDELWCHMYHDIWASRPMAKYGSPTI